MKLKIKRLQPDAKLPEYAKIGDSGMDVFSIEEVTLNSLERKLIGTGLALEIPSGYEIQVRPRSGMAIKYGIAVLNSPGTVDSSYRGELKIILFNTDSSYYNVRKGEKIAQIVLQKVEKAEIEEVDTLSETDRGTGGLDIRESKLL